MKKIVSLFIVIFIILMLISSTFVFATEVPALDDKDIATESDEDIIHHDIFEMHNEDYVMDQLVDGNAFIMANGDVRITGEINGSAFIMANGTVEISDNGLVIDSLYVLAKKVVISGAVYDIYAITQNFEMTSSAYVERDINILASNVKLRGEINRNVTISAESINVKDDKDSVEINGDFNYISATEIEGLDSIVKNGSINYIQQKADDEEIVIVSAGDRIKGYIKDVLASMVYVLVVYFLFRMIAPKFNERVGKDLKEKSIVGFAVGLLSYLIMLISVVVTIVLLITEIGAPVAVLVCLLLILGLFISSAIFQIAIFEIIAKKNEKIKGNTGYTILTLLGISLCVAVLKIIPYVGGIIGFVAITMGLGLLVRNIISREKNKEENIEN